MKTAWRSTSLMAVSGETGWLIGCDGAAGICREYLEADAPGKRHHTRDAYRLIILEHHRPRGGQATTVWLGEGGHIVHYPLADGRLNLVAMVDRERIPPPMPAEC